LELLGELATNNRVLVFRVKIVFYVRTHSDRDLQRSLRELGMFYFQFVHNSDSSVNYSTEDHIF
jgi:hypothetical protein